MFAAMTGISLKRLIKSAAFFFSVCTFFSACTTLDVYEKNVVIPKHEWANGFRPSFDFEITDTTSNYNIYVVIRHTDAYRYNNIWLNVGSKFPGDTMRHQRLDLLLGTDEKGWEGKGMDDIWELRKPITRGPQKLPKKGLYHFTVSQIMRENPLPNVMNIGIRVEKLQ
jgi:gliding motility-associated lipoprotein GldH